LPNDYLVADTVERWRDTSMQNGTVTEERADEVPQYPVLRRVDGNLRLVSIQFHDPQGGPILGALPSEDVDGAMDLKAVPRPSGTVISHWSRTLTTSAITYRYDPQSYSPSAALNAFARELPGRGWTPDGTNSPASTYLSFKYSGDEPLSHLNVSALPDASVEVTVTHPNRNPHDLAIFAGQAVELPADVANAHDLKAVPRPPDASIISERSVAGQVQITYAYDWGKHGKDEIEKFYERELPKYGWTMDQPYGQVNALTTRTFQ
jgi:hypothetical protein